MKEKFNKFRYRLAALFSRHQAFVVIMIMLLCAGWMTYRLFVLSNLEPDPAAIEDQTLRLQAVQFDQAAIEQMEALRDSNVKNPGTQLPAGRQNPFSE